MMRSACSRGITLVEILVVLCVVAVLAGILVPTLSYARGKTRTLRCAANLNQISVATKLYYDDHHGAPMASLVDALADYVDSRGVFVCPEDRGGCDSYSPFFVSRSEAQTDQFLVGCPRHDKGAKGVVGYGEGRSDDTLMAEVRWNGSPIQPGEVVTGGELTFADGSRVSIINNAKVRLFMSFTDSGVCHSVIRVPKESYADLQCQVTPGSRFEVVTPASIAGVEGTKFDVVTGCETDAVGNIKLTTDVGVYEGKVKVTDQTGRRAAKIGPGEHRKSRIPKGKAKASWKN